MTGLASLVIPSVAPVTLGGENLALTDLQGPTGVSGF